MTSLSDILDMKIDIGIRHRNTKKKFNKHRQLENILGDKFDMPENCRKFHNPRAPRKSNNQVFHCSLYTYEDVMEFRSQIYKSNEKRDIHEFLFDFCKAVSPKSHNVVVTNTPRMFSIKYDLPKLNGQRIFVCKAMFQAVTGLTTLRLRTLQLKLYKNQILLNGDQEYSKSRKNGRKAGTVQKILVARKEELLSLKKGAYKSFVQKMSGLPDDVEDNDIPEPPLPKPKKGRKRKISAVNLDPEFYIETFPNTKSFLNLECLEICRICLKSDANLISVFNKEEMEIENNSIADLINFCLPIEILEEDELPKKICQKCRDNLLISYKMKTDCLESQKIMDCCLESREIFVSESTGDALETYMSEFVSDAVNQEEKDDESEEFEELGTADIIEPQSPELPATRQKKTKSKVYGEINPRKCFLCDVDFDTTPDDHFSNFHTLVEMARCKECEFETEFPWFMNLHLQVHADDIKLCPYCGKVFESLPRSAFASHRHWCRNKLKNQQKTYTCSDCKAVYKNHRGLKEHIRLIHTKEKPYACSECGERFIKRITLRRHMMKHGIGATCHCSNCGKQYLQRYELTRHEKNCLGSKK